LLRSDHDRPEPVITILGTRDHDGVNWVNEAWDAHFVGRYGP
jgi:hypothetical protein